MAERLTAPGESEQLLALFDALPDVFFFAKDRDSRFSRANAAFLAMHGCRTVADLSDMRDDDFHPPALAAEYVAEDRRVMASRKPLRDQVWLVSDHTGMPNWYLCTKLPLFGSDGAVSGVAGILRPFDHAGNAPAEYRRLTPVMQLVAAQYHRPIGVGDLAAVAGISASQLQREFRRLFGMSPGDYVLRTRLSVARQLLETTSDPVGRIAISCGFYDQSHFTKAFRGHTGLPPQAYRRRFRRDSSGQMRYEYKSASVASKPRRPADG
jgi:AraC-like DNA-binding protein